MAEAGKGIALASVAAGVLLAYAGLTGKSVLSTVQATISGQAPSTAAAANTIGTPASDTAAPSSSSSGSGGGGSAPAAPSSPSGNAALGQILAQSYGWSSGAEWNALYALWERESGWSNTAKNAGSGAYGIPQALPPTKMPAAAQEAGGSDPTAQIQWGLSYISSRYGDPIAAWAHEQSNGWY